MAREQIAALLHLLQPAPQLPVTRLERAKQLMELFCNEWYTDLKYVVTADSTKAKLQDNEEFKTITQFVLNIVHGVNSVRFLKEDNTKAMWQRVSGSETCYNFIHAAAVHLSNNLATNDADGWDKLVDEIARAESCLSGSQAIQDAARSENIDILPKLEESRQLLERSPWMVVVYILYRTRFTRLFRELPNG